MRLVLLLEIFLKRKKVNQINFVSAHAYNKEGNSKPPTNELVQLVYWNKRDQNIDRILNYKMTSFYLIHTAAYAKIWILIKIIHNIFLLNTLLLGWQTPWVIAHWSLLSIRQVPEQPAPSIQQTRLSDPVHQRYNLENEFTCKSPIFYYVKIKDTKLKNRQLNNQRAVTRQVSYNCLIKSVIITTDKTNYNNDLEQLH